MKKIAILTFSHAFNYGALLQAYALKKAINCLAGTQAFCIDCRARFYPDTRWWRCANFTLKKLIKTLSGYPFFPRYFHSFMRKYLQDTPPLLKENLPLLNDQFDLFVAGSDQIWNFEITREDSSFLLDFVKDPRKKGSYAASFGFSYIEEKHKSLFSRHLSQFDFISVREQAGARIIKELTGRQAAVVLDPTLLLPKEHWQAFAAPIKHKRYVLLYLMHEDEKLVSFAKELAKRKRLDLMAISFGKISGVHCLGGTPEEFVGYFQHADYVLTNSFHGLIFALVFNKKFIVGKLPPSCAPNSRLEQILRTTNLENRLWDRLMDVDESIDWTSANIRLQSEREKSSAFLRAMVLQNTLHL